MFTLAILALNFASLAGIVAGLLLSSARVRDALEAAYVHSSDMADGRESHEVVRVLIWSFVRTALLNSNDAISLKKLLIVSFLSSVVFGIAMASVLPDVTATSPAAEFFGGGDTGVLAGELLKYLLAWPGHYIYDYLVCRVLLWTSKSGRTRTLSKQLLATIATFLALSFFPILVLVIYYLYRYYILGLSSDNTPNWEFSLIFVPFFWNGPTLFWTGIANRFLQIEWLSFADGPRMILFLMSAVISSATAFFDLLARALVSSKIAMRGLAAALLKVSSIDAHRLFTASLTTFAIGNGLCQVFGISMKL